MEELIKELQQDIESCRFESCGGNLDNIDMALETLQAIREFYKNNH